MQNAAVGSSATEDTVSLSADALSRARAEPPAEAQAGRTILLKRVFEIDDPSANPRIDSVVNDGNQNQKVGYFLTREDRDMLAKSYEYAEANGIDAVQVDLLAFDLGIYRLHELPGGGKMLDGSSMTHLDGRPMINVFAPEREARARDILSSKALDDTKIDRDFLRHVTNPGLKPKPAVDFGALRELVFAFSASHSDGALKPDVSFADRDARIAYAKSIDENPELFRKTPSSGGGIDGKSIMMSRLYGQGESDGPLDGANRPRFTKYLSEVDKDMLGGLYAAAKASGADLVEIDKMAEGLGALRKAESLMKLQNELTPDLSQLLLVTKVAPPQNAFDAGKFRDLRSSIK